MILFLTLLSGICWTIVYIDLIRLGFKERTYGMPLIALALNLAWESLYSYINLRDNPSDYQSWILLIWFLLDIVIFYTYLRYGKKQFPKQLNKKYFLPWTIIIFIMAFIIQVSFYIQFGFLGAWYSAFIQNLIMSLLFINMLVTRINTKGQSLTIAILKCIGTLAPTFLYGVVYGNQLVLALGIFCLVFDIIYIYYLNIALKKSYHCLNSTKPLDLCNSDKFDF